MGSVAAYLRFIRRHLLSVIMTFAAMAIAGGAQAQEVDQELDNFVVLSNMAAQGVIQTPAPKRIAYADDDPASVSPAFDALTDDQGAAFTSSAANPANYLSACQTTGTRGLYCLNTKVSTVGTVTTVTVAVLRWQNPDRERRADVAIRCSDLNLSNCSGLTVDFAGRLYVAGQAASGSYSLFKSTERDGVACAATEVTSANYCSVSLDSGRSRLYDLSMVDGDAAYSFQYLRGVLALEDPAPGRAVFFPATGGPGVVLNGSWPVTGQQEVLQGATLLQRQTATDTFNYILVTTSAAKVFGYLVPWGTKPNKAFDTGMRLNTSTVTANTSVPVTACAGARYSLRASLRTDRVYFTSGSCVSAFDPQYATRNNQPGVSFPTTKRSFVFSITSADPAVPATALLPYQPGAPAIADPLIAVTVSPGISIDFVRDGCTSPQGCEVIRDGGDTNLVAAAKLARVTLADNDIAGWVVYKVTGMPDCRYIWPRPALCVDGTVLDVDGNEDPTFNPTQQYLNITPLLPPEITDSFAEGELPPMLVQPDYSARQTIAGTTGRVPYTFDALFGVPEEGLVYREWFDGVFDVRDLLGSTESPTQFPRCGGTPLDPNSLTPPPWDVVFNISELAPTVGGPNLLYPPIEPPEFKDPYEPKHVSMMLNVGCDNPTRLASGRGSAFVYGFELSPTTQDTSGEWRWPDSRYALLMRTLGRDFGAHLYTYACKAYPETDPAGPAPLSAATCYQLQKDWPVLYDKLTKCVDATDQPKNSAGANACGAFDSQFPSFRDLVMAAPLNTEVPPGTVPDPFNYVGELKVRMMVLLHVYQDLFVPSIKDGGFVDPN